ncbi:TIGR02281 family clan AA aspartic protease [Sphingobium sp. SCG-1]|uniref:retropepsin-like aspartic protease family protein n=1 Tax=Sphingobium sp. SCG-1 TaxID=2072936 RepID=UPI001CB88E9C|nr:TIGR02281 family clan AA aspartic protease [Sphingobium sp. SCG-1]
MIVAWIGIFTVILTIASYHDDIAAIATRVSASVTGRSRQTVEGGRLRIPISSDGHYWVEGTINDVPTRFLIDSGATITALSVRTAQAASIDIDTQRMPLVLNTANGPAEAQRGVARRIRVGSISIHDLPVVVSPGFGDVSVLGMNILSRLKSWRVEDGEMILEP